MPAGSAEEDVLRANEAFYRAFRSGDVEAMEGLWAVALPVACVHPGWPILVGRDEVMESWRAIMLGPGRPDVQCRDAHSHLLGSACFVTCIERIGDGALAATNVFVLEDQTWRLVHHHAGPIAQRAVEPEAPTGPLN